MISYNKAKKLTGQGNLIPLHKRIAADLDTPVSVFLKLASRKKRSFLLESIEGGEKLGRYSFIGFDPFLTIYGDHDRTVVHSGRRKRSFDADPIEFIDKLFRFYKPVPIPNLPRFTGGGVGYFAYDTIRWRENIPDANKEAVSLPPLCISIYSSMVAFDHLKQEIIIIANLIDDGQSDFKAKYEVAVASINEIERRLHGSIKRISGRDTGIKFFQKPQLKSMYTQTEFEAMVRQAKRYIREGDIFQVVLSQSWKASCDVSPLSIYRGLRRINPSPYMFLLIDGDNAVVGSSPEMLVRVENRTVETRPIAGTRQRGIDAEHDGRLEKELLADPKELAEHTMLLDLGRNDIGRVAQAESVKVRESFVIEKYSHVMHIVSSVAGELKPQISSLQALYACFPAGTVSGAPKIRAMEIIDELEKYRRGVYAGAVGYLDFHGNLDSCIAIRTLVKKGNDIFVQAGAGIVADSRPKREYEETKNKAEALYAAIRTASDMQA